MAVGMPERPMSTSGGGRWHVSRWLLHAAWLACGLSVAGCGDDPAEPTDTPVPSLRLLGEAILTATVGDTVSRALQVQAQDARDGTPLSAKTISFTITDGDATILYERPGRRSVASGVGASLDGITDADGVVAIDYAVPTTAGFGAVIAILTDGADTVHFGVIADAGPVAAVLRSGDGQVGPAGAPLSFPLATLVQDRFGNPVSAVEIAWQIRSGGGTLDGPDTRTDDFGRAYAQWILGPEPGAQEVDAEVAGAGTFAFTATAR